LSPYDRRYVDDVLVAAESAEVRPLLEALTDAEIGYALVERAAEVEQAVRTSRASLVVLSPSVCDAELRSRLRRDHPDRLLVVWLPRASTSETAGLLEEGAVEVLDSTMGASELGARLRNAWSRVVRAPGGALRLGRLSIDITQGTALWDRIDLGLTRRELAVLQTLAESPGCALRREVIYRQVWGFAMARGDRTVDVNVKRVRAKLAAAGAAAAIVTRPGVGYQLEIPTQAAESAVTRL
jgi:DNA-binding response OmpR family regulator